MANYKKQVAGGPLMAVDALGRPTPDTNSGAPVSRENRLVGMFYFLWLGEHGRHKPYDISKITAEDPDIGHKPASPLWGGYGVYHHWGEPFYGYYYSNDEWVVRRHMKLLMQADVDFLFFDTTNAAIYRENAKLVMRVLQEYHDEGWKIPQVMFYTNTASGLTVLDIYDSIYKPGWCPDTWFCLDGKPVIVAPYDANIDKIKATACRAAQTEYFNKIPLDKLRSLYNAFKYRAKDLNATKVTFATTRPTGHGYVAWTAGTDGIICYLKETEVTIVAASTTVGIPIAITGTPSTSSVMALR